MRMAGEASRAIIGALYLFVAYLKRPAISELNCQAYLTLERIRKLVYSTLWRSRNVRYESRTALSLLES